MTNVDPLLQQLSQLWNSNQRIFVEQLVNDSAAATSLDSQQWLEMICHEVVLREKLGERPELVEYQTRFPHLANELGIQWAINRLMNHAETLSPDPPTIDAPKSDSHNPEPTQILGRYEIRSELGRGAIGVVFLAWDSQLDRLIAIKRLRAGLDAKPEELDRMRAEAHAIAKIKHPNIVQIFDVGSSDGLPFLVMEYCSGGSLAKRLDGHPMPYKQAAKFVLQVGHGVIAAHAMQIIHRDLKPANILLEDDAWVPKVTDFGLAKLLDNDSGVTATGAILGTPSYMAPEQALGDAKHVGPAADIYSIGAILYECLTGHPPFRGVTVADTLDQVLHRDPIGARQLEPSVPIDLDTIVHKCLRKDSARRYESVSALVEDLRRFLAREQILARRERWHETSLRLVRRYPLAASLLAMSAILILTILVGSLSFANYMYTASKATQASERAARLGQADALVGRAHGTRLSGRPGQRINALTAIRKAAEIGHSLKQPKEWFEPLRDEAVAAMLLSDCQVESFRNESADVRHASMNDDQSLYALLLNDGQLMVRKTQDHRLVAQLPTHSNANIVRFVGSSSLLVFDRLNVDDLGIEFWDLTIENGSKRWSFQLSEIKTTAAFFLQTAISQDGKRLLATNSREMIVLGLEDGKLESRWPVSPFSDEVRLALHPTQPWVLLFSYESPFVELRDWRSGDTLHHWFPERKVGDQQGITGADWSSDGTEIVLLNGHSEALNWYALKDGASILAHKKSQRAEGKTPLPSGSQLKWDSLRDRMFMCDWSSLFSFHDFRSGHTNRYDQAVLISNLVCNEAGVVHETGHRERVGILSIAVGNECRVVSGPDEKSPAVSQYCSFAEFDPTGRFLIGSFQNGFAIVDTQSGRTLRFTKYPDVVPKIFAFDGANHLYMSSELGTIRFPYQITDHSAKLTIGDPVRVHMPSCKMCFSCSDDGKTMGAGAWNGYSTLHYSGGWIKTVYEPAARNVRSRTRGAQCAVSPDGKYVAILLDSEMTVFQTDRNCEAVAHFSISEMPSFSRDGRWLIAGNRRVAVGSWKESSRLAGGNVVELSPQSKFAVCNKSDALAMFDVETGKLVSLFEHLEKSYSPRLSLDQTRMLALSSSGLWLYDLVAIRQGLQKMDLDWDAPPLVRNNEAIPLTEVSMPSDFDSVVDANSLFHRIDLRAIELASVQVDDGHAQFSAGMAAIEARDYPAAKTYMTRACHLLPSAVSARLWRAYVLAEMQEFNEAIADADWALTKVDDDQGLLLRSEWHYRIGQYEESIADCTEFFKRFPKSIQTIELRLHCNEALGRSAEAVADQQLLEQNASTHHNDVVGMIRGLVGPDLSLRRPVTALLALNRLYTIKAESTRESTFVGGLVLYRNGLYQEAIKAIQPSLAEGGDEYQSMSLLVAAMAHAKLGDGISAKKEMDSEARITRGKWTVDIVREIELLRAEALTVNDFNPQNRKSTKTTKYVEHCNVE